MQIKGKIAMRKLIQSFESNTYTKPLRVINVVNHFTDTLISSLILLRESSSQISKWNLQTQKFAPQTHQNSISFPFRMSETIQFAPLFPGSVLNFYLILMFSWYPPCLNEFLWLLLAFLGMKFKLANFPFFGSIFYDFINF